MLFVSGGQGTASSIQVGVDFFFFFSVWHGLEFEDTVTMDETIQEGELRKLEAAVEVQGKNLFSLKCSFVQRHAADSYKESEAWIAHSMR